MRTFILCAVLAAAFSRQSAAADAPFTAASGNYLGVLDLPKEKLAPGLQPLLEAVKRSKVPSREAALGAVLRFSDDKPAYMRDARLQLGVEALYILGRQVLDFAPEGGFMWVVTARMPSGLVQVFYVSASTGRVMTLFPDSPNPTVQRTGASRSGVETNRMSSAAGSGS